MTKELTETHVFSAVCGQILLEFWCAFEVRSEVYLISSLSVNGRTGKGVLDATLEGKYRNLNQNDDV